MMIKAKRIRAIHAAKTSRGLSDEDYRELLKAQTGKTSSKDMSMAELDKVLSHINGGRFRPSAPRAGTAHAAKARALWASAYYLGVVRTNCEAALTAFAKRQCGIDALQWIDAAMAGRVIEAIKDMMAREAGVFWSPYSRTVGKKYQSIDCPRGRVIEAQWKILDAHLIRHDRLTEVELLSLQDAVADQLIRAQGELIRIAKGLC